MIWSDHRNTVIFKCEGDIYVTSHCLCQVGNDLIFSDLKSRSIHVIADVIVTRSYKKHSMTTFAGNGKLGVKDGHQAMAEFIQLTALCAEENSVCGVNTAATSPKIYFIFFKNILFVEKSLSTS